MRSAWRRLQDDLKLCHAVLFVLDSRIVASSRHAGLEATLKSTGRPLLFVLNKSDLAQADQTQAWIARLQAEGHLAVALTSTSGRGPGPLRPYLEQLQSRVHQRGQSRGLQERATRLMVAGLPNVGKSSLLNRLVGRGAAATGKKPGLTRGRSQWVEGPFGWSVLDSPGITYPRIETGWQLAALAAAGCVRADVLPLDDVCETLLRALPRALELPQEPGETSCLEQLARQKHFLLKGGVADTERAARWLLSSLFEGRFGRLTLEVCPA